MDLRTDLDYFFMRKAYCQALRALAKNEVPIGAVVVSGKGQLLGRGHNKTEANYGQNNHAEVLAIQSAGKKLQDWRLTGATLYVTLEPCAMCVALICLSRIERIVYGATSPLFGHHLDKETLPNLYKKHIKGITAGIMAEETELLLKNFFKKKRNESGQFRGN